MSVALTAPGVMTISEAAAKAKISPWLIRSEIKQGKLRSRRIGRCIRILDGEYARWLRAYEANASVTTYNTKAVDGQQGT